MHDPDKAWAQGLWRGRERRLIIRGAAYDPFANHFDFFVGQRRAGDGHAPASGGGIADDLFEEKGSVGVTRNDAHFGRNLKGSGVDQVVVHGIFQIQSASRRVAAVTATGNATARNDALLNLAERRRFFAGSRGQGCGKAQNDKTNPSQFSIPFEQAASVPIARVQTVVKTRC